MFYLAACPQFIPLGDGAVASAFVLVSAHALINALWFSAVILLFARLVGAARSGRFQRWLKAVTGVVFVGFGARLDTYLVVLPALQIGRAQVRTPVTNAHTVVRSLLGYKNTENINITTT